MSTIFPRLVKIAPLDVGATATDSGLREPVLERANLADRVGRRARREGPPIWAVAQVSPKLAESLKMGLSGQGNQSNWWLYFDKEELALRGLICPDGQPRFRLNDRLVSIHDVDTEELIWEVRTPPGLYIIEVKPSFGFEQLFHVRLQDREITSRR